MPETKSETPKGKKKKRKAGAFAFSAFRNFNFPFSYPNKLPPLVVRDLPRPSCEVMFLVPGTRWGVAVGPSARRLPSFAEEHHVDGFEHRAPIQKQGEMANVIEVEAQLLDGVLEVLAVGIVDLRPARDAGADQVTEVIVGNLPFRRSRRTSSIRPAAQSRLISPRRTFQSCGSSSRRALRRNAPKRVTRWSSLRV